MSVRFQLVLPDDFYAEIKHEAARRRIPASELIRSSVREQLDRSRAKKARRPLGAIVGLIENEEPGLSSRVDEILYE